MDRRICCGRGGAVNGSITQKHRKNRLDRAGDLLDCCGGSVVDARRVAVVCGATGGVGIFPFIWTRHRLFRRPWLGRRWSASGRLCAATFAEGNVGLVWHGEYLRGALRIHHRGVRCHWRAPGRSQSNHRFHYSVVVRSNSACQWFQGRDCRHVAWACVSCDHVASSRCAQHIGDGRSCLGTAVLFRRTTARTFCFAGIWPRAKFVVSQSLHLWRMARFPEPTLDGQWHRWISRRLS